LEGREEYYPFYKQLRAVKCEVGGRPYALALRANSGFGFPESMAVKLDLTIHAVVFILFTVVPSGYAHFDAQSVHLQVCVIDNSIIIHNFTLKHYLPDCSVIFSLEK